MIHCPMWEPPADAMLGRQEKTLGGRDVLHDRDRTRRLGDRRGGGRGGRGGAGSGRDLPLGRPDRPVDHGPARRQHRSGAGVPEQRLRRAGAARQGHGPGAGAGRALGAARRRRLALSPAPRGGVPGRRDVRCGRRGVLLRTRQLRAIGRAVVLRLGPRGPQGRRVHRRFPDQRPRSPVPRRHRQFHDPGPGLGRGQRRDQPVPRPGEFRHPQRQRHRAVPGDPSRAGHPHRAGAP